RRTPEEEAAAAAAAAAPGAPAAPAEEKAAEPAPVIREADPELERLLAEEEEIERRTRQHHETPHFRQGDE
ncbi:MAG: 30S ribosomal protein S3, partial [Actinomycetota bacterium]|nr:30S ribosomal protein S3 [Actinomycetota bacterium]